MGRGELEYRTCDSCTWRVRSRSKVVNPRHRQVTPTRLVHSPINQQSYIIPVCIIYTGAHTHTWRWMNRTKAIRVGCPGLKDKRTRLFSVILTCDAFTDRSDKRERNSISNENNISYTTRKVQRVCRLFADYTKLSEAFHSAESQGSFCI